MTRLRGDLLERTRAFAIGILSVAEDLPSGTKGWEIGRQLVRSGTSIGANLREADCALTNAEFVNMINIARREAAETVYWLELSAESGLLATETAAPLAQEALELQRVLTAIVRRTKRE